VIASKETEGITADLYQQLIKMLESGKLIREYTQVYESKTHRIPVQHIARDIVFFPFSRNNHNKLYLSIIRFFEIALAIVGLCCCLFLILSYLEMGSIIKGNYFIRKNVGDGVVFLF
jgi:hypothetical protein